jgi:hypothetical protein
VSRGYVLTQLALVVFGFQAAAIIATIATGNWTMEPPALLVKVNPLWAHFGRQTFLIPGGLFENLSHSTAWREGMNMVVWAALQWVAPAVVLDFMRSRSN